MLLSYLHPPPHLAAHSRHLLPFEQKRLLPYLLKLIKFHPQIYAFYYLPFPSWVNDSGSLPYLCLITLYGAIRSLLSIRRTRENNASFSKLSLYPVLSNVGNIQVNLFCTFSFLPIVWQSELHTTLQMWPNQDIILLQHDFPVFMLNTQTDEV